LRLPVGVRLLWFRGWEADELPDAARQFLVVDDVEEAAPAILATRAVPTDRALLVARLFGTWRFRDIPVSVRRQTPPSSRFTTRMLRS
jgi:hypothetical protein